MTHLCAVSRTAASPVKSISLNHGTVTSELTVFQRSSKNQPVLSAGQQTNTCGLASQGHTSSWLASHSYMASQLTPTIEGKKKKGRLPCPLAVKIDVFKTRGKSKLAGSLAHPFQFSCNFSQTHLHGRRVKISCEEVWQSCALPLR